MVADQDPQSALEHDYSLTLIQARIAEKRLFEARFLCRRLGDGLGADKRQALARELDDALGQVEQLRRQAQALMAAGDHGQAGLLYRQIEAIAVDVPGVAEERQALAGAEALAARLHKAVVAEPEPVAEVVRVATMADDGENAAQVARQIERPAISPAAQGAAPQMSRRPPRPGWRLLAVGGLVLGALALGVLLWSRPTNPPPPAATSTIIIQPLQPVETAAASAPPSPPPEPEPPSVVAEPTPAVEEPSPPAPPEPVSSTPALHLGSLHIKPVQKK